VNDLSDILRLSCSFDYATLFSFKIYRS